MKFKSRKDSSFKILFLLSIFIVLVSSFILHLHMTEIIATVIVDVINGLTIGFIIWVYFTTSYEINDGFIHYKSAFISGSIPVNSVRKIQVGETQWVGMKKFGLARNGLIITYNKYDDLYISPVTNESFVNEILKLNAEVEIK